MRRIAATLAVVGALLFSAGNAWADFSKADAAYERGDFATALKLIRPLAEQGDADAQNFLGFMYFHGDGVPKNLVKAARWYGKSAYQGHEAGEIHLGSIFFDASTAEWKGDHETAFRLYLPFAEQGIAYAQHQIGFMYGTGKGVPVNYVKAYMWYSLAQARSHELPTSGDQSMFMVNAGNLDIVKKLMTPSQIGEAQRLANEIWEKYNN